MGKRFLYLWFRHLKTDWFTLRRPALKNTPFVLTAPDHGKMIITAANRIAQGQGIDKGMAVADARVLLPDLEVADDKPQLETKLLKGLARWAIRYCPITAIDRTDGIILDISGCAHLWGGEREYLKEIITRLRSAGYDTRAAIADTVGAAWAMAKYGKTTDIIEPGGQTKALLHLPPAALRLEQSTIERMQKLGLYQINHIIGMPRQALRRRFGKEFLLRLDQALGNEEERIEPVQPIPIYQERLPCLEPICTAGGIGIALIRLLETLCERLQKEGRGFRSAVFTGYRVDGKIQQIAIGTNRATNNNRHLFKLFEEKISTIEPDLGIELFILEATKTDEVQELQESLWAGSGGLEDSGLSEMLDRVANKVGPETIHRFLPDEHYWPERSIKQASPLMKGLTTEWPENRPRPIHLLSRPEPIEVTAPIPDYPPMLFRYRGRPHKIKRADGPERIENEWWLEKGKHRDYYIVEDEGGARYWVFRSGHYTGSGSCQWYLHGFFA